MKNLFILALFFGLTGQAQSMEFIDSDDFPTWSEEAIEVVEEAGVMTGFGDGSFRPDQNLTRAEAVTLLLRAKKDLETTYNGVSRFPDVGQGVWFEEAVGVAAQNGWVQGRPDGFFYPGDNLTRAEFATLVSRAFDLEAENLEDLPFEDTEAEQWFTAYIGALYEHDLLRNARNRYFRPEQIVTRAEAAWTFAQIINKPGINGSAADMQIDSSYYGDSRRVAIKPKDFEAHKQGYEVERQAIHIDVDVPEDEIIVTKDSDWSHLGNVRVRNTLDYRGDLEHIQLYLRFDRSGTGPANAFEIKVVGLGDDIIQQIYRNGEVTFTGLDLELESQDEAVLEIFVRRSEGASFFPKETVGTVYVKDAGGEAFKPFDAESNRVAEILTAPIEYNSRNLQDFTFKP